MSFIYMNLMNIAVMFVANIIIMVLQSMGIIHLDGGHLDTLLMFAVFGFVGSYISLFLSKSMAIRSMNVHVFDQPNNETEYWLYNTVKKLSERANMPMPEVGIYEGAPNAFATGATKGSSLVAVSTGLMQLMNKDEVEGVLAHEIAHISNGDMQSMTLMQGVMNTFVFFFSHLIGRFLDRAIFKSNGNGMGYYMGKMIAQMVLTAISSIFMMWFSRYREYRADAGGAAYAGKAKMIAALQKLQTAHTQPLPDDQKAFGIVSFSSELFMTHPPLEKRIARLYNS
jgi:heat shock protein HtpX